MIRSILLRRYCKRMAVNFGRYKQLPISKKITEIKYYALKVHKFRDGINFYSSMKLSPSLFALLLWCSKYCCTISSVMFPLLQHPYHTAQKCRPQYFFFNSGNSSCILLDERPFSIFTISLTLNFGGYSMCMWTCSLLTNPFNILTSNASHICFIKSLHRFWTSPSNTWYRYFVIHTICTVNLPAEWPSCLFSSPIQQIYQNV